MGLEEDDNRCTHGCPVLPAPDHVVSLFMDALWADSSVQQSAFPFLLSKTDNQRRVCDNATFRKMALEIMVAINATSIIQNTDGIGIKVAIRLAGINVCDAIYFSHVISVLEQYNGNGNSGFILAVCKAIRVADDELFDSS